MTDPISNEDLLQLLVGYFVFKNNLKIVVIFSSNEKLKEFKQNLLTKLYEVPEYLRPKLVKTTIKEVRSDTCVGIDLIVQRKISCHSLRGIAAQGFYLSSDIDSKSIQEFIEESKSTRPFTRVMCFT